jgi:hypothetical protein
MFTAEQLEFATFLERTARGQAPIHAYGTGLTATQTFRKALAPPIYGGANEIQGEIIGKGLEL